MATTQDLPRFDQIFIIGIWVETALWGINSVIFFGVFYVLFWRQSRMRSRWLLLTTSLWLYLGATLHIAISLRQELEAFILVPPEAPPEYASIYFSEAGAKWATMKNSLYMAVDFVQDLVLIWRLYIVWDHNWKIAALPIIVELAHIGVAYAGIGLLTEPNIGIYNPVVSRLGSTSWSLELIVNFSVTGMIAYQLWYTGHRLSRVASGTIKLHSNSDLYISSILTIVESGALLVIVTIVMLVLYECGHPAALMVIDIATQVAALVPNLIIVRVGLGLTHSGSNRHKSRLVTRNPFSSTLDHERAQISIARSVVTTRDTEEYALRDLQTMRGSKDDDFNGLKR
ncbi:hypothetical protein C8Q80DRAFT_498279 [Daedaleopsis nitida]|nr:hypothetical protein C8Q80DRAFT_498279 [Daedaleopsis nitida]